MSCSKENLSYLHIITVLWYIVISVFLVFVPLLTQSAVIQRETLAKMKPEFNSANNTASESVVASTQPPKQYYRRSYCTAEEKIQSELKEMQMREEELR